MRLITGNTRLDGSGCCSQAPSASVRSSSALNPEEAPLAVKKRKADFAFPRVTEVSVHPRWMWGGEGGRGGVCQDDRASSLPSPVNLVHSVYHPSPWRELVWRPWERWEEEVPSTTSVVDGSPGFSSLSLVWRWQAGCPRSKAQPNPVKGRGPGTAPMLGLIQAQSQPPRPGPLLPLVFFLPFFPSCFTFSSHNP